MSSSEIAIDRMELVDYTDRLFALIEGLREENTGLRAENKALQEIIFRQQGLLEEKIIVPEAAGAHVGREPWYIQKAKLERSFRSTTTTEDKGEENAS